MNINCGFAPDMVFVKGTTYPGMTFEEFQQSTVRERAVKKALQQTKRNLESFDLWLCPGCGAARSN